MTGVVFLFAWVFGTFGVLALLDRKDVTADRVEVGGKYRVARRRVRVLSIRPGAHWTTLALVDVDTGERAVVTYHNGAKFRRRRFGR